MQLSLAQQCKALKLANVPLIYQDLPFHEAEQYLNELFAEELRVRQNKRIDMLIKTAGFPNSKSLENFDWSPVTMSETSSKTDLTELKFIERCENILAVGAVGTGKTFLATALGLRACAKGKAVRFFRCLDLVNILLENHRLGRLKKMMSLLGKAELLIIDELGFVPLNRDGAELLFNVVAQAYEKQSIIITSNLQFGHWNSVLGDNRLTAALIDRLVHHAHILAFAGKSYRLKQALSGLKDTKNDNEEAEIEQEMNKCFPFPMGEGKGGWISSS
ncbi:MAG: Insertion sequence IS5376 putative ATP-binding protein [Dehalococcoidia bacterium]|nr:Insertion sequence IS5376 putative ATP-binding protein [Chloroflexota bacterium]